jgi:uncharacterized membrane protein YhaH (DUF805 family)
VVLFYPLMALISQRLNDLNRPGWQKWVFWVPTVLATGLALTDKAYAFALKFPTMSPPEPTVAMTVVTWLSIVIGLWAVVDLGFIRGTYGDNPHGPDPIGG